MRGLIQIMVAAAAAAVMLLAPAAAQAGGVPALAWSPSGHDYGTIGAGTTAAQEFTLTNSGGSASGALTIALSGSGSAAFSITADACTGTALGKGKSCAVTVEYAPTTAGQSDTATLTASGKKPSVSASVTLTGSGAGTPDLTLSPGTFLGTAPNGAKQYFYDFGPVASATTTFTVTNSGTATSGQLHVIGGDPHFILGNDTCTGNTLAVNGTCTFDVAYTAGAGCNPGDPVGPAPVAIQGGNPALVHDIDLTVFGECPFS
jgi:hypothetical protein